MSSFDVERARVFVDVAPNHATMMTLHYRLGDLPAEAASDIVTAIAPQLDSWPDEPRWTTLTNLERAPWLCRIAPSVWLDGNDIADPAIPALSTLRHVRVDVGADPATDTWRHDLARWPRSIEGLSLTGSGIGPEVLTLFLDAFPSLRTLGFGYSTSHRLASVLARRKRLPRFEALDLHSIKAPPADIAKLLAREELLGVRELGVPVAEATIAGFTSRLAQLSDLGSLTLDCSKLRAPEPLMELLRAMPRGVRRLDLRYVPYGRGELVSTLATLPHTFEFLALHSPDLADLDPSVPCLREVRELSVRDLAMGDEPVMRLVASPPPSLRSLVIRACDVGPEAAEALARSPMLAGLELLDLAQNPIGARTAELLAERSDFAARVVSFTADHCELPARALAPLVASLAAAPRLAHMMAIDSGNGVDRPTIEKLRELRAVHVNVGVVANSPQRDPVPSRKRYSLERRTRPAPAPPPPPAGPTPWPRIDAWLEKHAKEVRRRLRPPLTEERKATVERRLGFAMPTGLAQAYAAHDGQRGEAGGLWSATRVPKEADWARYMSFLSSAEMLKQRAVMLDLDVGWSESLLPLGEDGGGNVLCLDADTGEITAWDHETAEHTAIASDLTTWMTQLADDMEAGRVSGSDEELERVDEPPASAPETGPRREARTLIQVLLEHRMIELADRADSEGLLEALAGVLAAKTKTARRRQLARTLEDHPAVAEIFVDDDALAVILDEFV